MTTELQAQDLIDISIQDDRTATGYPETENEFDALYSQLLIESDDDCDPEFTTGQGYNGPDARRGSVIFWGAYEGRSWKVEIVNPPRQ